MVHPPPSVSMSHHTRFRVTPSAQMKYTPDGAEGSWLRMAAQLAGLEDTEGAAMNKNTIQFEFELMNYHAKHSKEILLP